VTPARPDPIATFFEGLGSRGHEPLLDKASGSARFDVIDGKRTERWLLVIEKGDIRLSRRNARADAVVRATRSAAERIVAGKMNLMAALLRGELEVQGDPRFLVHLQRLFPRPSRRRAHPSRSAGNAR
jgi:putative sterol carrier protein